MHRMRPVRRLARPTAPTIVHPREPPSSEHDLRTLAVAAHRDRRVRRERVVLCVPVEHEFAVVHLADLALLLVDAEVARADRG